MSRKPFRNHPKLESKIQTVDTSLLFLFDITMARLLEFEEDGLPTLIKKSTLLGQQKEVEIFEKALGENVGDLPLGKALHLLLHVHSHVFDNAVNILQQSDLLELTLRKNDSPAVRALLSLDNYVKSSEQDRLTNFKHIYDSVKEKFLKKSKSNTNQSSMRIIGYFLLNSQYKDDINTFMCNELRKNDKRNQLAAVLLIDFIFFTYIASSTENHWNLISLVAPELIRIAHQSNQPTLLCTTSCELALKCAHYLLINLKKPILSPSRMVNDASKLKIIEIDPVLNTSEKIHHLNGIWRGVDTLLCLMEKWSTPNTHLTHSAFSELHSLFQNDVGIFDNESKDRDFTLESPPK
ncbi:hypothetical protein BDB01DRAFT_34574 [Pilobolus umbonatus]|nr:hypothetical protein BDB01DRAFT_34574 [Pilobolus umbonatus]